MYVCRFKTTAPQTKFDDGKLIKSIHEHITSFWAFRVRRSVKKSTISGVFLHNLVFLSLASN